MMPALAAVSSAAAVEAVEGSAAEASAEAAARAERVGRAAGVGVASAAAPVLRGGIEGGAGGEAVVVVAVLVEPALVGRGAAVVGAVVVLITEIEKWLKKIRRYFRAIFNLSTHSPSSLNPPGP